MKGLETGKDKIQKICDALRKETLDPAKQEAREIIENAHLQAAEILTEAKKKSEELLVRTQNEIEEKKRVFHASLQLASRQGVEDLKQRIEKELFNKELARLVEEEMAEPKVISEIITSLIRIMEAKGMEEEFVVAIPKKISARMVSSLLAQEVLKKLHHKVASVGDFAGGVEISLKGANVTIDISDKVVRELIGQYIRRDLRNLIFNE